MNRILLLVTLLPLIIPVPGTAQPCDCKWPVDVILLQTPDHQPGPGIRSITESLKKGPGYLFVIKASAESLSGPESQVSYHILKAGRGNRIVLLGCDRLHKDGTPLRHPRRVRYFNPNDSASATLFFAITEQRNLKIAVTRTLLESNRGLVEYMPRFDLILAPVTEPGSFIKTFIRFDRGRIIFFREDTIR